MNKQKAVVLASCVLLSAVTATTIFAASASKDWSYDTNSSIGPAHWGDRYADCKSGGFQSPINMSKADLTGQTQAPISLWAQAVTGKFSGNDHTVLLSSAGQFLTMGKTSYSLVQMHFHAPSESQLNNQRYPLEAHFVMQDSHGRLLVLAIFIKSGKENLALGHLLQKNSSYEMSLSKSEVVGLFPENLGYYTFEGSLTTPPCDRGVTWVVLNHVITASPKQLAQFLKDDHDNSRPAQAINNRSILAGVATVKS